ncbi:restriction endonuclease subunit S [Acinetobacter sp. 99]
MEKQKCPEIRFKGFDLKWEKNILGDITTFVNGRAYSQEELLKKGKYPVLRVGNFNTNSHWYYSDLELGEKYYAENGDLLYTWSTIFSPYIWKGEKVIYHYHIWKVELSKKLDKLFTFHFLKADEISLTNNTNGSTMIHVTKGEMEGKIIHIPVLTEQIPIGNFFQNLDQSIALHEKKLSQTQNLKKAMLEKMFPKVGNKQPEIRLKGFSGDWDTISLGSLCSIGDIDHRMPESTKSGIPYLMTGDFFGINGLDFENAKLISNEDYEQLSKKIKPEIGDILFARYASVGTVRLVVTDVKFLISYSCAILKTSVNSNGEYLFYWFQNSFAQNQIEQEINTGSQRNIGIDSLKKLSVILPKTNEQKAIAYFFKSLDETLALQQQQLQTLKNLKQSFLEKMFV